MEWINIASDAVKIGMGALIAGGFGYLVALTNTSAETKKLYIKKKQLQLDKVVEILNSFHKYYAHYRANVRNYTISRGGLGSSSFSEEFIEGQREKLRSAFDGFVDAESYVLSIGSVAVSEILEEFRVLMNFVLNSFWDYKSGLSVAVIDDLDSEVRELRKSLFLAISAEYMK
ncbi:hypothetical protein D3C81_756430 [compost metagenome]